MTMKMINYLLNRCDCFTISEQRSTFNKRKIKHLMDDYRTIITFKVKTINCCKREWSSWLWEEWLSLELGFLGHFNALKSLLDSHYMNWIVGIKLKDNHLFIKVLYIYSIIVTLHISKINTQNIKLMLPKPERQK